MFGSFECLILVFDCCYCVYGLACLLTFIDLLVCFRDFGVSYCVCILLVVV